jgi:L-fucose isomerase-like protein
MMKYEVKIGLVPMRRDVSARPGIFNWEKAAVRGHRFVTYIEKHYSDDKVSFVDLNGLNKEDLLFSEHDVPEAARRLSEAKVDAICIINCNFGNEEVAGQIAKAIGKPVLLWAPLDDEYASDGMRYTDSQCGAFGISRQFQRRNIPFSYIETCRVENPEFDKGFRKFCSVVCMVNNFKGMRIAEVGMRPKPFCSVIYNEGELMQKFDIQVIPVNMAVIIDRYNAILKNRDAELEKGAEIFAKRYEIDDLSRPLLKKQYAFVLLYRDILKEYNVQAISAECWTAMQLAVGAMPCSAYSILADEGIIIGCESDLHGTISMMMLAAATMGRKIPFFGEFTVRHPTDKNVQLLWHCGPFAYSLKKESCPAKMVNMRQWFCVKEGKFTVARFDQDNGKYSLLSGTCESADGPQTFGTYRWVRFKDRAAWERKLIDGPYIHHMAEIEGDYTEEIKEFCKYIPGLVADSVDEGGRA